jgi:hypothetical protein
MITCSLHHRREDNEDPLALIVQEALELVMNSLKFTFVLLKALKHDTAETIMLVELGWYRFH